MIPPSFACGVLITAVLTSAACAHADELPGFRRTGESWQFEKGDLKFNGVLLMPEGSGPFPAVLISHGLGGSAESFGLQKAREMVKWGYVCIAPNYTHNRNAMGGARPGGARPFAPGTPGAGRGADFGASKENLDRAETCLRILGSLPNVDEKRLFAYGHSMGGFVTIGLAARGPKLLSAAAISGSGIALRAGYAAPSGTDAEKIRTPFIMFHGLDDTTVRPEQSRSLQEILDRNKVPNRRHTYEGVGHPVDQQLSSEMYKLVREWFSEHATK